MLSIDHAVGVGPRVHFDTSAQFAKSRRHDECRQWKHERPNTRFHGVCATLWGLEQSVKVRHASSPSTDCTIRMLPERVSRMQVRYKENKKKLCNLKNTAIAQDNRMRFTLIVVRMHNGYRAIRFQINDKAASDDGCYARMGPHCTAFAQENLSRNGYDAACTSARLTPQWRPEPRFESVGMACQPASAVFSPGGRC